jgi:hypothetical protein
MPGKPAEYPTNVGEDNRATATGDHCRQLMLCAEKCAGQIGVESRPPHLKRQVGDRSDLACGASVVESDVEPAETFNQDRHQSLRQVRIADIAGYCRCRSAPILDVHNEGIKLALSPRGDDNARASSAKSLAVA